MRSSERIFKEADELARIVTKWQRKEDLIAQREWETNPRLTIAQVRRAATFNGLMFRIFWTIGRHNRGRPDHD
jgi:hypothetical protein